MQTIERKTLKLLTAIASLAFFAGACAPFESEDKADADGTLNKAEIAVWVQNATNEQNKFRVLFAAKNDGNKIDTMEVCEIPANGLPDGFVCNASRRGYQKLTHLTDKGNRKIFVAEKLALRNKVGYAAYAKDGSTVLFQKPRKAFFGLKNAANGSAGNVVQFSQVKQVMDRSCGGGTCHGAANSPRDDFFTSETAFTAKKAVLLRRINTTDQNLVMPRGRQFQGNDKQVVLDYLNKLP